jgi:tRNA dimethylallyltransferase
VTTLPREPHLAIVGPTASGKSALAFALASERDDTEIVSLDSMQVYRGMDVGTAKPSPAERAAVAHHLIDVADPADNWSVRRTQTAVRVALDDIEARGRRAILVGGTGLYVHAVVDALAIPRTLSCGRSSTRAPPRTRGCATRTASSKRAIPSRRRASNPTTGGAWCARSR